MSLLTVIADAAAELRLLDEFAADAVAKLNDARTTRPELWHPDNDDTPLFLTDLHVAAYLMSDEAEEIVNDIVGGSPLAELDELVDADGQEIAYALLRRASEPTDEQRLELLARKYAAEPASA